MICYRCGTALGAGRHCLHCGADVTVYRKIVRISNGYYNAGLDKARLRDLSGAKEELLTALRYDKRNINARNLLGLIYYETGEVVEALCQWVISKNMQIADNPADDYIGRVQSDKNGLEIMNQAIRDYNQALEAVKSGGDDLAVIQLQRVISRYPHMMKAYQLLALLYIRNEEYSRAGKLIKKGLQIDEGNVPLQKYAAEIRGKTGKSKKQQQAIYIEQAAEASAQDVIIPPSRERSRAGQFAAGAITGLAIALACGFFLIRPSVLRSIQNADNHAEIAFNEKLEDRDAAIAALEAAAEEQDRKVAAAEKRIEQYDGEDGTITNYIRVFEAINQYRSKNWVELKAAYEKIHIDAIADNTYRKCYDDLGTFIYGDEMVSLLFAKAMEQFERYQYSACAATCQACLDLKPDYVEAIYYLGLSLEAQHNDKGAAPYFQEIVDKYPDSTYYKAAKKRVS